MTLVCDTTAAYSVPTDGKCHNAKGEEFTGKHTLAPACVDEESVHKCKNYCFSTQL